jgi:hypothetical protein
MRASRNDERHPWTGRRSETALANLNPAVVLLARLPGSVNGGSAQHERQAP